MPSTPFLLASPLLLLSFSFFACEQADDLDVVQSFVVWAAPQVIKIETDVLVEIRFDEELS
jgi:hypothetical protein